MSKRVAQYLRSKQKDDLLKDLFTFCVLTKLVPDIREQPHREMCEEMEEMVPDFEGRAGKRRKLFLAPRYTYKTSLVIALIIYLLCKYPQIKILIYRAQRDTAQGMLREVKGHLTRNGVILEHFGDMSKGSMKWDENEIVINRRQIGPGDRDPSVGTAGIDVSTTGMHPDIVIADDVVVRENCDSIVEMQNAWEMLQSCEPLLPPKYGTILVTGTLWSNIDMYSQILVKNEKAVEAALDKGLSEEAAAGAAPYKEYIRTVYVTDEKGQQQLFFPDFLDQEFIDGEEANLEPRFFNSWYFQRMVSPEMKPFKRADIVEFTCEYYANPYQYVKLLDDCFGGEEIPVWCTIEVDPALTGSGGSDAFGIVVTAFDPEGNWLTFESHEMVVLPSVAGDFICDLLLEYEPELLLVESANADADMMARIGQFIYQHKLRTKVIGYSALQDEKRGERGKRQRINAMEPRVRSGKVWMQKGRNNELKRQLDLYPSIKKDDVIDAWSMGRKAEAMCPPLEAIANQGDDGFEKPDNWLESIHALQNPESPKGERIKAGYGGLSSTRLRG
jgi:hypothetical protein